MGSEYFPLFPEQASTVAPHVDALLFFLLAITGFFTVLIATLVVYFAVKYRRRSEADRPVRIIGSIPLEIVWTAIPFVITMIIFVWGASLYFTIERPPDRALQIYVVPKQWMWKFQHPEGQREINDLHVPAGRPVRLTLISQ